MKIRPDQKDILSSFRCLRVQEIDQKILSSISGPIIDGGDQSRILNLFCHPKHLLDDVNNELASYVVLDSEDTVLLFFSFRCGELFENLDYENLELVKSFLEIYQKVNDPEATPNQQDMEILKELADQVLEAGLTTDDILYLGKKKAELIADLKHEPSREVTRVSEVFPGVELKFFGITQNGKQVWRDTKLPGKVGVTLFWQFVIPKLEEIQRVVGCKYMYLFAADEEADGSLVSYYRTRLHLDAHHGLTSNKPRFDFSSWFLYQDIAELKRQRTIFFDNFNSETF